jgi:hypothetical protein
VLSLDHERAKSLLEHKTDPGLERENSRFVSRLERGSGTVGVHDKRFGNDHHTPIDQAEPSRDSGRGTRTGSRGELSESFQEARALAIRELGQEARTYVAQTDSGIYCGKIIGETDHHIVQRLSCQTAVAHLRKLVGHTPELDCDVTISYRSDKPRVRELRERNKTAEIAR